MSGPAFLVLAHSDPQQLWRLIRALGPQADKYVHIDAKADFDSFYRDEEGVTFVEPRVRVTWAGYSMVEAILNLVKAALQNGKDYSHLVLLSGSDYPIKRMEQVSDNFVRQPDREFIRYIDMRESPEHYMRQLLKRHYREPVASLPLVDRAVRKVLNVASLPNSWSETIVPFFGSTWWALTPRCCRFMIEYIEQNPSFESMNRRTFSPDEHFFHTIVGNSPFASRADGLQKYLGVGTVNLANFHLIDPTLAKWFSLDDLDDVLQSDKLFVRKVRTETSSELLDAIDDRVHGRRSA